MSENKINSTSLQQLRGRATRSDQSDNAVAADPLSNGASAILIKEVLREMKVMHDDISKILKIVQPQTVYVGPPISTSGRLYPSAPMSTTKPPYEYGG